MALQVLPMRPQVALVKQKFHKLENALSNLKMDVLHTKLKVDATLAVESAKNHVQRKMEQDEKIRTQLKQLEQKQITIPSILNARAMIYNRCGNFLLAAQDLKQAIQAQQSDMMLRLNYLCNLSLIMFYSKQWQQTQQVIQQITKYKALPTRFAAHVARVNEFCLQQIATNNGTCKDMPMLMRFLSDDIVSFVYSFLDQEAIAHMGCTVSQEWFKHAKREEFVVYSNDKTISICDGSLKVIKTIGMQSCVT